MEKKNKNLSSSAILMIAPTPFFSDRGCHIRVLASIKRLEKGNEIHLLTYPLGRDISNTSIFRVPQLLGYSKTSPGFSWYKPFLDLEMLFYGLYLVRKYKYKSLHCHLHEGAFIGMIIKKITSLPYTFDSQGQLVGELTVQGTIKKSGWIAQLLTSIERFLYQEANEIIVSSSHLQENVTYLTRRSDIKVIDDQLRLEMFRSKPFPIDLLPSKKHIIGYLGGLQPYKGTEKLLEMITLLGPKYHLLLMGYPTDIIAEQIRIQQLSHRVTIVGQIPFEQSLSALDNADVLISPKMLDSGETNAKLYLYKLTHKPIICFDEPENRKILQGYPLSHFVPLQDGSSGLAKTIQDLYEK